MTELPIPPPRLRRKLPFLALAAALLAYAAALAVGPRIPDQRIAAERRYLFNVRFDGTFGLSVDRDAIYYLGAAADPARLFDPKHILQSRPGLPLLLSPAFAALPVELDVAPQRWTLRGAPGALHRGILVYAAANVGFVLIALGLAVRYAGGGPDTAPEPRGGLACRSAACAGAALLAFNALTREYLLIPHTQMLTPLCMAALVTFAAWLIEAPRIRAPILAGVAAAFGLGALAYGSFVLAAPVIVLALAARRGFGAAMPSWPAVVAGLALVLLPNVAWIALVRGASGQYYAHELEAYRQIVWMLDLARDQGRVAVLRQLARNVAFFAQAGAVAALPGLAVLLVAAAASTAAPPGTLAAAWRAHRRRAVAALLVAGIAFAFFVVVGMRASRLAFGFVLPLFMLIALSSVQVLAHAPMRARGFALAGVIAIVTLQALLLVLGEAA